MADVKCVVITMLRARSGWPRWHSSGSVATIRNASDATIESRATGRSCSGARVVDPRKMSTSAARDG